MIYNYKLVIVEDQGRRREVYPRIWWGWIPVTFQGVFAKRMVVEDVVYLEY